MEDGSPVTPDGSIPIPAFIDGAFSPRGIIFMPNGDPRAVQRTDSFNYYGDFNYLQINLERDTVGMFTRYEFHDTLSGYMDASWSQRNTNGRRSAS